MTECNAQLLSSYIDDELPEAVRPGVEAHLRTCPACQGELRALRETSRMIGEYPFADLTVSETAALHEAVETGADQPVMRLGLLLSALAASVLIISCTWLMDAPHPSDQGVATKTPPARWENLAVNLNASPDMYLNQDDDAPHVADAKLMDWMIDGLRHN